MINLEKEYQFYLANKSKLLNQYANKFLVIIEEKVIAAYNSYSEAISVSEANLTDGLYLVQKCVASENQQVFHSMVEFNDLRNE